jgi:large subunit ribosomal protein L40
MPAKAKSAPPKKGGGKVGGGALPRSKRQQKKKGGAAKADMRMNAMRRTLTRLSVNRVPPPLRMGRNRFLRHWTIHRAWLLFRRQQREKRERNLMRQHQSMYAACEALRKLDGPHPPGYLYRVAMEKKGMWRMGSIPIEYARPQTETPARVPWNHDWKR